VNEPRLHSELETPIDRRTRKFRRGVLIVAGCVAAMPVLAFMCMPRFGDDNPPRAHATWQVNTLANEDFPRWQKLHPDERCPPRLSELDDISVLDPWGQALQYTCDPRLLRAASPGIAITSAGEDGTFGTADDIGSDP
jgi:hypothetical protein